MIVPFLIGERLNVTGSAAFAAAFRGRDWAVTRRLAAEQVRGGVSALDVCLSGCGKDELEATQDYYSNCRMEVPVLVDSMNVKTMEMALKSYRFVYALNSANLSRGVEHFDNACELAARYKVSLVIGCIDQSGIAVTAKQKLALAEELITRACHHLSEKDLVLDLLALPAKTMPASLKESIEAVRMAALTFPAVRTLLAISNVSYGLPNADRERAEADFLQRASDVGLSCAIVNAGRLRTRKSLFTH